MTRGFFNRNRGFYEKVASFPAGYTNDGIFGITITTGVDAGNYIRTRKGSLSVQELGVLFDGTDQSAIFNAAFAVSYVKEIVVDNAEATDVTITGNLNCQGKKLTFRSKNRIVGVNTISDAILDIPLQDQGFTIDTTLQGCRSVHTEFTCENFGAIGNGSDETVILQKTSDTLIANNKMPRTIKMFSGKNYGTTGWLWHNWNGSNYDQFSISLIGEDAGMGGNPSFSAQLTMLSLDSFGLGVQRITGFIIKGINFSGPLTIKDPVTMEEFYTRDYQTFASVTAPGSAGPGRDTNFSPMGLFTIDPFCDTVPSDGGYPGWTSFYRGSSANAGSTAGVVEDCTMIGATVCILVSPNGITQQAENMVYRRIYAGNCKAVFGICQQEHKDCMVEGGYVISKAHTILDVATWGAHRGQAPNFNGWNQAGTCVRFMYGYSQHTVSFKNLYLEAIYTLGFWDAFGPGRTEFTNSTFYFSLNQQNPVLIPQSHLDGIDITFRGCTFRYYDDHFDKRLSFKGVGFAFNDCYFDLPPIMEGDLGDGFGSQQLNDGDFSNCYYGSTAGFLLGWNTLQGRLNASNDNSIPYKSISYEPADKSYFIKFECGNYAVNKRWFSALTNYDVNAATKTATANFSGYQAYHLVGDYLYVFVSNGSGGYNLPRLGRIATINYSNGDITLDQVPVGMANGINSSFDFITRRYNVFTKQFTGNYHAGNNQITNIFGDVSPFTIDTISGMAITGFSAGTATLAGNFNGPDTDEIYALPGGVISKKVVYFKLGAPTDIYYTGDTTQYFPGDKWLATPAWSYVSANPHKREFVCVTSGYLFPLSIMQSKQAVFKEVTADLDLVSGIRTISANDSVSYKDTTLLVDTSAGNIVISYDTLMDTNIRVIKKISADANVVNITPASGSIDGAPVYTLSLQYEKAQIQSDLSNLYLV